MDLSRITPAFEAYVNKYVDWSVQCLHTLSFCDGKVYPTPVKMNDGFILGISYSNWLLDLQQQLLNDLFLVQTRIVEYSGRRSVLLGNNAVARYIYRQLKILDYAMSHFHQYQKVIDEVKRVYPDTRLEVICRNGEMGLSDLEPGAEEYNYTCALYDRYCATRSTAHPLAYMVGYREHSIYNTLENGRRILCDGYKAVPFRMKVEIVLQAGKKRRNRVQAQNVHVLRPIVPLELRNLIGSFLCRPCC